MNAADCPLIKAIRSPWSLHDWTLAQWDTLLRQAHRADLLPRLAWLLREANAWQRLPDPARFHLESAEALADKQQHALMWELSEIARALEALPGPVVLLKGAAYFAMGLPPHHGRLFGDIDLLVPRPQIEAAEAALMLSGWEGEHHTAYDQRYYRQWMHEIPPMRHLKRLSVIDLHHAILPITARTRTDSAQLFTHVQAIPGSSLRVLCPADMVLHSATHLFHESEFHHGTRDLVDLDALLRHFDTAPGFWKELASRAETLNLTRPLFYALRYCRALFDTPVPVEMQEIGNLPMPDFMDMLFARVLTPQHDSCADAISTIAAQILYVRGHWLRMPMHLLIPHLFHKAFLVGRSEQETKKDNGA